MKTIDVVCTKSTGGAFIKGEKYKSTVHDSGEISVKGVEGYDYQLERGMWGAVYYNSSDRKSRFTFEPVMDE